jgi:hypothetical protein
VARMGAFARGRVLVGSGHVAAMCLLMVTRGILMMTLPLGIIRDMTYGALGYIPYRVMRRRLTEAPFPPNARQGFIPGTYPVFLAVIGEATAIGFQTVTADLTLAAQLARRVDRCSDRGVRWEAITTRDYTIRTARQLFHENPQLILADVVVVMLGIGDSLRFTPPWLWRRHLNNLLSDLREHLAASAVILVAEVPPLELSPETPARMAPRVGHHVHVLNDVTRAITARFDNTASVPFPAAMVHEFETPDGAGTFYGRVYRSWAAVMSEHIAIRNA